MWCKNSHRRWEQRGDVCRACFSKLWAEQKHARSLIHRLVGVFFKPFVVIEIFLWWLYQFSCALQRKMLFSHCCWRALISSHWDEKEQHSLEVHYLLHEGSCLGRKSILGSLFLHPACVSFLKIRNFEDKTKFETVVRVIDNRGNYSRSGVDCK